MSDLETYAVTTDEPVQPSADPQLGTLEGAEGSPDLSLPTGAPVRPEGLPENYATVADLAAANLELQQKLTQMGQQNAGDAGEVPSFSDLRAQADEAYRRDGDIPQEVSAAIEQHYGISRDEQLGIAKNAAAAEERAAGDILDMFGGEEGFKTFSGWAQENMSEAELTLLNSTISQACTSGELEQANLMIQGAVARFNAGQGPRVESGTAAPTNHGITPYANRIEAQQVIASDGYRLGDPKVHDLHQRRLAISDGIFR